MSIHHAHNAHAAAHHHQRRSLHLHSPREIPTNANTDKMPRIAIRNTDASPQQSTSLTPTMANLLIALLVLVIVAILAIIALFFLRARRSRQRAAVLAAQVEKITSSSSEETLPVYHDNKRHSHKNSHRRLTITAAPYGRNSAPIVSYTQNEKEILLNSGASSPTSPIPEIRITFPEEEDEMGKRKSGRVVVVKVSDLGGVGLEPLREEKDGLPAYTAGEGWKELDLEGMGGLKEKSRAR